MSWHIETTRFNHKYTQAALSSYWKLLHLPGEQIFIFTTWYRATALTKPESKRKKKIEEPTELAPYYNSFLADMLSLHSEHVKSSESSECLDHISNKFSLVVL